MLRGTLLYLANQDTIRHFVTHNRLARRSAQRFVAGETLEEALQATAHPQSAGASASRSIIWAKMSAMPPKPPAPPMTISRFWTRSSRLV